MSRDDVYQRYKLPDGGHSDLEDALTDTLTRVFRAQIRAEMDRLGYPERPGVQQALALPHPSKSGVVQAIRKHVGDVVQSIVKTVNEKLRRVVDSLPEDVTVEQANGDVHEFFRGVKEKTNEKLVPWSVRQVRQTAVTGFYRNNPALHQEVQWQIEPTDTAGMNDECDHAVDLSPMSSDDAAQFDFPAHRGCPHLLVPVIPDGIDLPDAASLWTGD